MDKNRCVLKNFRIRLDVALVQVLETPVTYFEQVETWKLRSNCPTTLTSILILKPSLGNSVVNYISLDGH